MKCKASELNEVIKKAGAFVPKMTPMDVLKCFRFLNNTVQASSLHLGALLVLPNELIFEKPVHVNAEMFSGICKRMVDEVTITVTDKAMKISDATSSFKIPTVIPESYPQFPECTAKYTQAPFIHPAMKAVKEFAMEAMSSQVYAGAQINNDVVVATDHKVLAVAQLGAKTNIAAVLGPNILDNFWDDLGAEIAIDQNIVFVKSAAGVIFGNTVEGKFLDYTKFVHGWKFPVNAEIKLEALKKEIPKLGVINKDKDITWAICTLGNGKLIMQTTNHANDASVEIPVTVNGEAKFRINVQMISKWMQSIRSEDVKMSCDEGLVENTPIKFEGYVADDKSDVSVLTAYIMPMIFELPKGVSNAPVPEPDE